MTVRLLSPIEKRMLALLDRTRPERPGNLGQKLWGKHGDRKSPARFARSAGRVLNALRKKGLAEWIVTSDRNRDWGWVRIGGANDGLEDHGPVA